MSRKKILIVDDEKNILSALRRELLEFFENYDVVTFNSAQLALNFLEAENFNTAIIISDQKMPGIKGSEFLLKVKKKYPDIIGIILTAHAEISDLDDLFKAGIFSFILKPWEPEYLKSEINKALQQYIVIEENKKYLKMIKDELKWGGELQKTLLQRKIPESKSVNFYVDYHPLPELNCGGDYYDIISLNDNYYLILLGDVAGHGIKAAFITAILKSIIYNGYVAFHRGKDFSPAGFLSWLNDRLCEEFKKFPDMLITFLVCLIDLENYCLKFSGAGHHNSFIIRENKLYSFVNSSLCLGVQKDTQYTNKNCKIWKNDKIIMFTDGLSEPGGQAVENVNINPIFLKHSGDEDFNSIVIKDIKEQFPGGCFHDDITLISINILNTKDEIS